MDPVRAIIYEDGGWDGLHPVTLTRPVFECRVGGTTLGRRLAAQLARLGVKRVEFLARPVFRPILERDLPGHGVNQAPEGPTLFLNGRVLCLGNALTELAALTEKTAAVHVHDVQAAVRLDGPDAAHYYRSLEETLAAGEPAPVPAGYTSVGPPEGVRLTRRLWDLVSWNADVIEDDFEWARAHPHPDGPQLTPGAQIVGREHILFREGVKVEPGAILDARSGPILVSEGVLVEHNAVVRGPAYLGPHTRVRMGAKLYDGVSAGPECRLGGEVEATIVQGYGNKQHEGFLGHAYLGAWVNLGAGTNNSDLKNNYGPVAVTLPEGKVDTGLLFAGCYLGDHVKTAIGARINTGTVVGCCANLFGGEFPPRYVPSFTWAGPAGMEPYRLDAALATARQVMARRGLEMEPADEVLLRAVHDGNRRPA